MFDFDKSKKSKQVALLLDPDKTEIDNNWLKLIIEANPDYILIGGSQPFPFEKLNQMVITLKQNVQIPLVGFPGDISQIHSDFDGLLALSVIQSRDYRYIYFPLIQTAKNLLNTPTKIFYTPYLILNHTGETTVEQVLGDSLDGITDINKLKDYLSAVQIINPKILYMEAGSGSTKQIKLEWIKEAKSTLLEQYLLVGGGIRKSEDALRIWDAGADCIVIGNAVEENLEFLSEICALR